MDGDEGRRGGRSDWTSAPAGRITPDDVQRKEFGTARVRPGYVMHEVDEFLDQVTDTLTRLLAENERLRAQLDASPGSPAPERPAAPSSAADRGAVDAFLQREKAFLQSLGSLVQGHAEELKGMVRTARDRATAVPASAAPEPSPGGTRSAPAAHDAPGSAAAPAASAAAAAPAAPPVVPPSGHPPEDAEPVGPMVAGTAAEDARDEEEDDVEAILESDDRDTRAIETVEAEEPIRVDEPEPANTRRSDDGTEGSLRELFWGEE